MSSRPTPSLAAWLREAPFTLAMSSGFFGFYAHCGLLAALEDAGLEPNRVRGSSAGALITSLWATGLSSATISRELFALRREDFWDPGLGFGVLRGDLFDAKLRKVLPHCELARCRVPVFISVFDVLTRRTEVASGRGDLVTAVRASCALPVLFQPVWIEGRPKLDGGIADRAGLHGLGAGERTLYHHLMPTSPWRKKNGVHACLPRRANLAPVAAPDLPRVTPFTLHAGRDAFTRAREYATWAFSRGVAPEMIART